MFLVRAVVGALAKPRVSRVRFAVFPVYFQANRNKKIRTNQIAKNDRTSSPILPGCFSFFSFATRLPYVSRKAHLFALLHVNILQDPHLKRMPASGINCSSSQNV